MDSEGVLEAVLRSRSISTGTGNTATLAVLGEVQGVVRRLLQKANRCPRIGRTLMDFVEWNPTSNKKGVDPPQQRQHEVLQQRHEISDSNPNSITLMDFAEWNPTSNKRDVDPKQQRQNEIPRQRHEISEPNLTNSTNNTTVVVGEDFLDRLRTQLLRIRVANLVRQDFMLAKQLGELKDLCQAVCADNDLGGDVFKRLWDMVASGGDSTCTPHTTSAHRQGAYGSLARDAAIVFRVKELLCAAAALDGRNDVRIQDNRTAGAACTSPFEGTNRTGDLLAKHQEMVSPRPAIENPADALPLLALAESLGAAVAVNACLAYIAAEENAVIEATKRSFCDTTTSAAVDWASAVHRLARWPPRTRQRQLAHSSKLCPSVQLHSAPSLRSRECRPGVGLKGADRFESDNAQPESPKHDEDGSALAPAGTAIPAFRNSDNPSYSTWSSGEGVVHADGPRLYHAAPSVRGVGAPDDIPVRADDSRQPRRARESGVEGDDRRTPPRSNNGSYQGTQMELNTSAHALPTSQPPTPPLTPPPQPPPPPPSPPSYPLSRVRRFQTTAQIGGRADIRVTTRQRQGGADTIHTSYSAMGDEVSRDWYRPEAPPQPPTPSPVVEGGSCDGPDNIETGGEEEKSLEENVRDCYTELLSDASMSATFAPSGGRNSPSSRARGPDVGKGRCQHSADDEYAYYGKGDPAGVELEEDSEATTSLSEAACSGRSARRTAKGSVRTPSLASIAESTAARRFCLPIDDGASYQYDRTCESVRPADTARLVGPVVVSPARRAQQPHGGTTSVLALLEEEERSCALARKRALLRVRLARQRQDLAGAVADANERGFRAERRRRRDEKVAALLIKNCGGRGRANGAGGGCGGDDNEWVKSCRRDLGDEAVHREESHPRNGIKFSVSSFRSPANGDAPLSDVDVQSHGADGTAWRSSSWRTAADAANRMCHDAISQQHCWEDNETGEAPRKPLKIVPHVKREPVGGGNSNTSSKLRPRWESLMMGKRCNPRGGVVAATPVEQAERGCLGSHLCAEIDDALSLVVRLDALYALPERCSYFDGPYGGGSGGADAGGCGGHDGDGKRNDICFGTGVYLVLESGRLRHQTAVQRPACCKVGTCRGRTKNNGGVTEVEIVGAGKGGTDPTKVDVDAWVFGEIVVLHLASTPSDITLQERHHHQQQQQQQQQQRRSPVDRQIRVLVYRNNGQAFGRTGGDSSQHQQHSSSCTGEEADRQSDSFIGVATLPLNHHGTEGNGGGALAAGVGGSSRRPLECTFSRPVEVSILSAESVEIGWLRVGVCGMTISTSS